MADYGGARNSAGGPKGRSSPATLQMKATFEEMARAHAPKALEIVLALARVRRLRERRRPIDNFAPQRALSRGLCFAN